MVGRRPGRDVRGRAILAGVAAAAFLCTVCSVRQLSQLVASQHDTSASAAEADAGGQAGWGRVLGRAEENIEEHLPHWLHHNGGAVRGGEPRPTPAQTQTRAEVQAEVRQAEKKQNLAVAAKPRSRVEVKSVPLDKSVCKFLEHTDYWGESLAWGPQNLKKSAAECCKSCQDYRPATKEDMDCNVWVWCGDKSACGAQYRECWLKHLAHPEATQPRQGDDVPWTSGVFGVPDPSDEDVGVGGEERKFHTIISAQGVAVHWQARVAYYWYVKTRAACEAGPAPCHMGGFTRLLHSGQPDELMGEVPTFVVDPLPPEHDNGGYVVLNRPWAFLQWLQRATIPEKYVLMSEPDHLWLRPMPNLMRGERPAAFPFFYIEPSKTEFKPLTEKFTGPLTRAQAESISPIGNAPTLMSYADLQTVAPVWLNTSLAIFNDKEAHAAWGWVQEMYGFTISCFMTGIGPTDLYLKMMSQPPWDTKLEPYYLLHYTYGMDYDATGAFTPGKVGDWRFDKRTYAGRPPPRNLGEPPDGMDNELVRHLIHAINEATNAIPGWDKYEQTGFADELWDGKLR